MRRLYLYLASRSKKGMKLITVLQGEQAVNSKLNDLTNLSLPPVWQKKIAQIIHDNRMLYEAHIESADSFQQLSERLKHRGYSNVPSGAIPMLHMQAYKKAPVADTSKCKITKTMIRKQK